MTGGDFVLRANPRYELVLFDRLAHDEQEALAGLTEDPDLYGILRDPAGGLPVKALNREAALLFHTMRQPGPAPAYLARTLGPAAQELVERCVLDGVLERRSGDAWVSGPAATAGTRSPAQGGGLVAELSRRALAYAATLPLDAVALSARLYFYNRLPATRRWRALVPDDAAAASYLRLGSTGGRGDAWVEVEPPADNAGWHYFAPSNARHRRGGSTYKLYVSPAPHDLPDALAATLPALDGLALSAKVGRGLAGMLRPDKLVAYFDERAALEEAAAGVRAAIDGVSPHGVPFSAACDGRDAVLSWGVDPPASERVVPWQGPSWRRWVTDRLASALASAARAAEPDPTDFALRRVALDGVDTATWAPLTVSAA